jgi:YHS domain-containing protein
MWIKVTDAGTGGNIDNASFSVTSSFGGNGYYWVSVELNQNFTVSAINYNNLSTNTDNQTQMWVSLTRAPARPTGWP